MFTHPFSLKMIKEQFLTSLEPVLFPQYLFLEFYYQTFYI